MLLLRRLTCLSCQGIHIHSVQWHWWFSPDTCPLPSSIASGITTENHFPGTPLNQIDKSRITLTNKMHKKCHHIGDITFLDHVMHHIPGMNINHYQGSKSCPVLLRQFATHKDYNIWKLNQHTITWISASAFPRNSYFGTMRGMFEKNAAFITYSNKGVMNNNKCNYIV